MLKSSQSFLWEQLFSVLLWSFPPLGKAISETLPKRFPYGRVLFPWLLHCFSPTCTCIHVRRDCLEVGINNEGYFGYPRFERKHGFHPVWAFQFSLACCLFLCLFGLFVLLQDSFCCDAWQTPMAEVFPSSMPRLVVQQSADAFHKGKMSRIFRCGHQ